MLTKTSEAIELLPLSVEDYEALIRYLVSFPGETRDAEFWRDRFRLWWEDNPAFSDAFEKGWVLKKRGDIIGFLGNFPTHFQLAGEPVIANNATTWRVSPDYRKYSLRLLYRQIDYSKETVLFMTTPSETVSRVAQTLKYQSIQRGHQGTSVLITNFEKVLAASLFEKGVSRLVAKGLAPVFDLIQKFRHSPSLEGGEIEVREIFKADSSFDELWKRTSNRYAHTNIRTAEVINWYCFGSLNFGKKLFGVYRKDRLLVYAIFANYRDEKLNRLQCLDFWGEPGEENAVNCLVHYMREYARKHSIDLIKFQGFSREMSRLFQELGLFKTPSRKAYEYFKIKLKLSSPLTEPNLYFTYMLGDAGL